MLRGVIIGLGVAMLAGAAFAGLAAGGGPAAVALGVFGAILLAGTLFERRRYQGRADRPPGPGWELTGERFRDPEDGVLTEVWFNPSSGQRRYVRAPQEPGKPPG